MFRNKRMLLIFAGLLAGLTILAWKTVSVPGHSEKQALNLEARASNAPAVNLNDEQVKTIKIENVQQHIFVSQKQAVGSIDFNQNSLVQVFTPYQGRIIEARFNLGDRVEKGDVLFTIDSPDLLAAESALIAATGVRMLQNRTLGRAKALVKIGGASQQSLDQSTSDQMTAEGAWKSARDAVRIFGKTEEEIDKIAAERKADPRLVIKCPLSGHVTARTAAPGLFVQPGVAPAPFAVADTSTMWMVANVVETDAPLLRVGQEVKANVTAYPGRDFEGKVTVLGPSIDPSTRRLFVRVEISDPDHLLRAGMFANFTIRVGEPRKAVAAPTSAIVREPDGVMTAWVTSDQRRFTRRTIKLGMSQNGFDEILEGLKLGEHVVTDGAVFLSNQYAITGNSAI